MKKLFVLLLTLFVINSCDEDTTIIDSTADKKAPKVDVCHYDEATRSWKTISVNQNALKAHLAHGDFEGGCDRKTYVPDDTFERRLIAMGLDVELDDYVLTMNIHNLEELWFPTGDFPPGPGPSWYLYDLTGIEDFIALRKLSIGCNPIDTIDLSANINLEELYLGGGYFTSLDLSNNLKLKSVSIVEGFGSCGSELQMDIDLTKNILLERFETDSYTYLELDLSKNILLSTLSITTGSILALNLRNGNNRNLTFYSVGMVGLDCMEVDDPEWSENNWVIPYSGVYSTDCGY
ncbi:hypothetical protein LCM02_09095 [Lutimonas saemankumensis]|uniref:hypothetical protein n=1 Tax=Lutimonas saemankumensis TaxID=483016 RepID=UPI001CD31A71|nr:hypothetical protein [Lutimonas saemankumensis]MCA0932605.1 hypothetical protein [Lutimonas saemankumensis]